MSLLGTVSNPVMDESEARSETAWFHDPRTRNTIAPKLVMGCSHCFVMCPCFPQFVQYTFGFIILHSNIRALFRPNETSVRIMTNVFNADIV